MYSIGELFGVLYNICMVGFLMCHLLFAIMVSFAAGVYTGMYVTQNYEVARVDEPRVIFNRVVEWAEQYRKKD